MRLIVFFSQNCFLAGTILLVWTEPSEACDLNWIRYMIQLTCGKKKRELSTNPDEIFDSAPTDFDTAFRYFRMLNPEDPFFMKEKDNEKPSSTELPPPLKMLLARRREDEDVVVDLSGLSKKLEIYEDEGIQSFPRKWNFRDLTHTKADFSPSTNSKPNAWEDLVEVCCNWTKRNSCTPDIFLQLCK